MAEGNNWEIDTNQQAKVPMTYIACKYNLCPNIRYIIWAKSSSFIMWYHVPMKINLGLVEIQ